MKLFYRRSKRNLNQYRFKSNFTRDLSVIGFEFLPAAPSGGGTITFNRIFIVIFRTGNGRIATVSYAFR